jgi:unsaturated rhamnogalacturonyl hydrolase
MKTYLIGMLLIGGASGSVVPQVARAQAPVVTLDYYFNNEWHKENGDSVRFHYTWEDKANSGFSKLGDIFTGAGFTLQSLTVAPTLDNLRTRKTSVYIIVDPDTPLESPHPNYVSPQDVAALKAWVKAGGVLVLMGNDKGNAEFVHFNTLATVFGIKFNEDCVLHVTSNDHTPGKLQVDSGNAVFPTGPLLYLKDVSSLAVQAPAAPLVVKGSDVIMATAHYGKGMVFAVGDPWVYNEYIDNHKLEAEFQNTQGATEWVQWLKAQARGR